MCEVVVLLCSFFFCPAFTSFQEFYVNILGFEDDSPLRPDDKLPFDGAFVRAGPTQVRPSIARCEPVGLAVVSGVFHYSCMLIVYRESCRKITADVFILRNKNRERSFLVF